MPFLDNALQKDNPLARSVFNQNFSSGSANPPPVELLWVEDLSHTQMVTEDGSENYVFISSVTNQYPLDGIDPANIALAYSIRQLRSGYTGYCMNIMRSSDSQRTDVLFDVNGVLTLDSEVTEGGTLRDWIGSDDGTVFIWYDQGLNGNNAVVGASSVFIILSGDLIINNVQPALYFNSSSYLQVPDALSIDLNIDMTFNLVVTFNSWSGLLVRSVLDKRTGDTNEPGYHFYFAPDAFGTQWNTDNAPATYQLPGSIGLNTEYSFTCSQSLQTSGTMYEGTSSLGSNFIGNSGSSDNGTPLLVGGHYSNSGLFLDGYISDYILLNNIANSSQRNDLVNNQIEFYNL